MDRCARRPHRLHAPVDFSLLQRQILTVRVAEQLDASRAANLEERQVANRNDLCSSVTVARAIDCARLCGGGWQQELTGVLFNTLHSVRLSRACLSVHEQCGAAASEHIGQERMYAANTHLWGAHVLVEGLTD